MANDNPGNGDFIHLPVHGGVRLKADDPRLSQLAGHPAANFLVIERGNHFETVISSNPLDIATATTLPEDRESLGIFPTLLAAVAAYRQWTGMEAKEPLPAVRQLKRAVTLDMWLPDGRIAHRYADAEALLNTLAKHHLAHGTLLYLPGWHGPYDTRYPAYAPAPELGGDTGFRSLLETAKNLDASVMLHLNYWGYDTQSRLLPDYQRIQLHDAQGNPMGWPGLQRTGATQPLAYMRVDAQAWQDLFFRYVEPLLTDFRIDALFLDQLGSHTGHDSGLDNGANAMLKRLRQICPGIILGGEIVTEALIPKLDLFQEWGMPWCGLELDLTDAFSPIVRYLVANCTKLIGHLGLPAATPCRYCWTNYPFIAEHGPSEAFTIAQKHLHSLGCLPHVRLDYARHRIDALSLDVLRAMAQPMARPEPTTITQALQL